ncbi:hypothetical protein Caci_8067 [Catenulispora acidiphila DSM 44928]|uniref:Uncharacterized protein n=1 Tax=Catenulispora acidiphila (strain DSM 44928 / JCM 14897 / NBRC 102108 / NRRL B-24433 / ID139908) TaxID=479433 RepID=C7QH40_CATAD|nr:hypothetical protein [Catenulispora acidiphila]ACU76890.1 hypothetical protein Caci_8067 [Catenulispora acidiphila DSM 44928]
MSETPSRRAAGRPPGDDRGGRGQYDAYDRQPAARGYDDGYGQQPRSGGRPPRPAAYGDDYTPVPAAAPARGGRGTRGRGPGQDSYDSDGAARDPRGSRDPRAARDPREDRDSDYDDAPPRGGSRRAAAPPRSGGSGGSRRAGAAAATAGGGPALPLGPRLGMAFAIGAIPALIIAFACGAASSGGSSRSIAGITLNSQLLALSGLAIPAMILIIGGLLRWRQLNPLGLTWGFTVVAGLSWLALLFAAQMEKVIPHLTPLITVPLVTGAAVAAAAYLTDENTTSTGRYACLAAVIASHIGIVAIVVSIVLA